jgi:hypothetical protein
MYHYVMADSRDVKPIIVASATSMIADASVEA